jgi:hypothetical protein
VTYTFLLKVNVAEVLMVLAVSVLVTLLFDLPMQEVKSILMSGGKQCMSRACGTNARVAVRILYAKLMEFQFFLEKN